MPNIHQLLGFTCVALLYSWIVSGALPKRMLKRKLMVGTGSSREIDEVQVSFDL